MLMFCHIFAAVSILNVTTWGLRSICFCAPDAKLHASHWASQSPSPQGPAPCTNARISAALSLRGPTYRKIFLSLLVSTRMCVFVSPGFNYWLALGSCFGLEKHNSSCNYHEEAAQECWSDVRRAQSRRNEKHTKAESIAYSALILFACSGALV